MDPHVKQVNQSNLGKLSKKELEDMCSKKDFRGLSIEFQAMVHQEIATRR